MVLATQMVRSGFHVAGVAGAVPPEQREPGTRMLPRSRNYLASEALAASQHVAQRFELTFQVDNIPCGPRPRRTQSAPPYLQHESRHHAPGNGSTRDSHRSRLAHRDSLGWSGNRKSPARPSDSQMDLGSARWLHPIQRHHRRAQEGHADLYRFRHHAHHGGLVLPSLHQRSVGRGRPLSQLAITLPVR